MAVDDSSVVFRPSEILADIFLQLCEQRSRVLAGLRKGTNASSLLNRLTREFVGILRCDSIGYSVISRTAQNVDRLRVASLDRIEHSSDAQIVSYWIKVLKSTILPKLKKRTSRVLERVELTDIVVQMIVACKVRYKSVDIIVFAVWYNDPECSVSMHQHGGAILRLWHEMVLGPVLKRARPRIANTPLSLTAAAASGVAAGVLYFAHGWVREVQDRFVAVTVEEVQGQKRRLRKLLMNRGLFESQDMTHQGCRFTLTVYQKGGAVISEVAPDKGAPTGDIDEVAYRKDIASLKKRFKEQIKKARGKHG